MILLFFMCNSSIGLLSSMIFFIMYVDGKTSHKIPNLDRQCKFIPARRIDISGSGQDEINFLWP